MMITKKKETLFLYIRQIAAVLLTMVFATATVPRRQTAANFERGPGKTVKALFGGSVSKQHQERNITLCNRTE